MRLSSATQSSRHSGNKVDCPRSAPSTKRAMPSPPPIQCGNHSTHSLFTQPGSIASLWSSAALFRFAPLSGHLQTTSTCRKRAKSGDGASVVLAASAALVPEDRSKPFNCRPHQLPPSHPKNLLAGEKPPTTRSLNARIDTHRKFRKAC